MRLSFSVLPGDYAITRLEPGEPIPAWAQSGEFFTATRTDEELSIVCAASAVPAGARSEGGWILLRLRGPFALDQVGILGSLTAPLAAAGVALFVVSTFDTDYLLVKKDRLTEGIAALEAAGHERLDYFTPSTR